MDECSLKKYSAKRILSYYMKMPQYSQLEFNKTTIQYRPESLAILEEHLGGILTGIFYEQTRHENVPEPKIEGPLELCFQSNKYFSVTSAHMGEVYVYRNRIFSQKVEKGLEFKRAELSDKEPWKSAINTPLALVRIKTMPADWASSQLICGFEFVFDQLSISIENINDQRLPISPFPLRTTSDGNDLLTWLRL